MDYVFIFIAGVLTASVGFSYIDDIYEIQKERIDASIKICEALDSKPVSLDKYSVTCENGMEISFVE